MKRRDFVRLVGGAVASWPVVARAQPPRTSPIVGVLMSGFEADPQQQARWQGFRHGLEKLGWSDGRNIHIDIRFAGKPDEFEWLAKDMVALRPDVIFVQSTGFVGAVARHTKTIPIVFTNVSDPIGAGLVANLARPGGNLTGLVLLEASVAGKWLSMLKEMSPRLRRATLVGNPKTSAYDYFLRTTQAAAPALGIEVLPNRVESTTDIESSFAAFAREPDGGVVVIPDATMTRTRSQLIALAARFRLPAVYPERFYSVEGGLMSYGIADLNEQFQQAASYVDRLLKGEKPADLPVQGPTKYSTILNLKTAKALGLAVPPGMLVAADEVIE
jgi:putative ABC transport system substrate-binding protein